MERYINKTTIVSIKLYELKYCSIYNILLLYILIRRDLTKKISFRFLLINNYH